MSFLYQNTLPLTAVFILGAVSILFYLKRNFGFAILFLVLSAGILRVLMTHIDPFIWMWDEQFHALVAKNMTLHPFKPTLYDAPLLNYDYRRWDLNHIWLHKQPLFLWQMALSMKVFGYSEWAFRLPSAIMSLLLVPVIYRMGSLVLNRETGFIAAFLLTFSFVFNELVTGSMAGDHNDVAFIFYVTLSVWAWLEYVSSDNLKWVYLIGLFAGLAILVKWMPGLLVYSGWFVSMFFVKHKSWVKKILILARAFLVTLCVFVPWIIYTRINYPKEISWELEMYHLHFIIPVEGHGGNLFYHFEILPFLYGIGATVLLLPALILLFKNVNNGQVKFGILTFIVITYAFYTVSATKMEFFCLIASPLLIIALANLINTGFEYVLKPADSVFRKYLGGVVLLLCGIYFFQIPSFDERHSDENNDFRKQRSENTVKYKKLIESIKDKKYVIVNCEHLDSHILMFYSGMPAYGRMITEKEKENIKRKGYRIYVFNHGSLPDYLNNDEGVKKISM